MEVTTVAPSIAKQDKPADVKAWLSQADPATAGKGEGKDETLSAVQQILQQTQQQQLVSINLVVLILNSLRTFSVLDTLRENMQGTQDF